MTNNVQIENLDDPTICDNCIHNYVCGLEGNFEPALKYCYWRVAEEPENSLITECRDTAIKEKMPLYFVYYEETGVFEIYITKTKELFEKRHCSKHLPNYRFQELARQYLDDYSDFIKEMNDVNP